MLEALSGRIHLVVLGGLVAMAAYFQAGGVAQLVAARLVPAEPPPRAPLASAPGDKPRDPYAERLAKPILARNAFDSVTGPLDGSAPAPSAEVVEAPKLTGDPYKDSECAGVKASLVTAADEPDWSFAAITGKDGKNVLRRRGDNVDGATVHHIGWMTSDEPDVTPRVWLLEGGARCIVGMGMGERSAPKRTTKTDTPEPKSSSSKPKSKLASDIESKIKKVGENRYEVERGAVEQIIQNYAKLAGSLRTRATKDGMKLSGVKPDSILGKLGMQNGDVMKSINGFDMSDPEKAVDAYARLRSAGQLSIALTREGASRTVDIQITK